MSPFSSSTSAFDFGFLPRGDGEGINSSSCISDDDELELDSLSESCSSSTLLGVRLGSFSGVFGEALTSSSSSLELEALE